jgi:hypothetical protein
MADIRNPVGPPALAPQGRLAPARGETVRAAQKAFFEAALAGSTAAPAAPKAAAAPVVHTTRLDAQPAAPNRLLRPGSLVDIKV